MVPAVEQGPCVPLLMVLGGRQVEDATLIHSIPWPTLNASPLALIRAHSVQR
jgi:hypothetical protein